LLKEQLPDQAQEQPCKHALEYDAVQGIESENVNVLQGIEPENTDVLQGIEPENKDIVQSIKLEIGDAWQDIKQASVLTVELMQVESASEIKSFQLRSYSSHIKSNQAEQRGFKYLLKDVLNVVVSAVLIAVLLKSFVIDSRIVPTGSMIPTIHGGDRVIMLELPYFFGKTPVRQDVVVFAAPAEFGVNEDWLKRVIGLPGDTVEVKNGLVYINGEVLNEPYINEPPTYYKLFEDTVPDGCYIMLGDNRNNSLDSHMWDNPYVPFSAIKGKVVLCYWPISRFRIVE
jgi:signal peptidase I